MLCWRSRALSHRRAANRKRTPGKSACRADTPPLRAACIWSRPTSPTRERLLARVQPLLRRRARCLQYRNKTADAGVARARRRRAAPCVPRRRRAADRQRRRAPGRERRRRGVHLGEHDGALAARARDRSAATRSSASPATTTSIAPTHAAARGRRLPRLRRVLPFGHQAACAPRDARTAARSARARPAAGGDRRHHPRQCAPAVGRRRRPARRDRRRVRRARSRRRRARLPAALRPLPRARDEHPPIARPCSPAPSD